MSVGELLSNVHKGLTMTSVTIDASNFTDEQFIAAMNACNPRKKQVEANPAVKYKGGELVEVAMVPNGIITHKEFVELIKTVPSTNIYHSRYNGTPYDGLLNPTNLDIAESLADMQAGDTLTYPKDLPDIGYMVRFGWTKLVQGWICTHVHAIGTLLVDVD